MRTRTLNILDELDGGREENLRQVLSSFSCPVNPKIENFFRNRAIDFTKRRVSITYLVHDQEDGSLLGCFALAHKATRIPLEGFSNTMRRKLERFARLDPATGEYMASAFLVAQLGKNYNVDSGTRITGHELMDIVNDALVNIQRQIGGGIIYLDSENVDSLKQFYSAESFKVFGERYDEGDQEKYIQYLRVF